MPTRGPETGLDPTDTGRVALRVILPPTGVLTTNQRLHWRQRADRTRTIRTLAHVLYHQARFGCFDRVHVTVEVSYPDRRRRDVHNLLPTVKAAIDGMVDAGMLDDDSDRYLVGPDLRHVGVTPGEYGFRFLIDPVP